MDNGRQDMTMPHWYLIRTKAGAEQTASDQLRPIVDRVFLPLAILPLRQKGRVFNRKSPLFPTYLFAQFTLEQFARQVRYTPGVRNVVTFGEQAAVVPAHIIDELTIKCGDSGIDLSTPKLLLGGPVNVVQGPFRDFDAVFDGYLSGSGRVAVLLSILNARRRVVMPVQMIRPANEAYNSLNAA
jgi:transcriptional antiterminator RfaH